MKHTVIEMPQSDFDRTQWGMKGFCFWHSFLRPLMCKAIFLWSMMCHKDVLRPQEHGLQSTKHKFRVSYGDECSQNMSCSRLKRIASFSLSRERFGQCYIFQTPSTEDWALHLIPLWPQALTFIMQMSLNLHKRVSPASFWVEPAVTPIVSENSNNKHPPTLAMTAKYGDTNQKQSSVMKSTKSNKDVATDKNAPK